MNSIQRIDPHLPFIDLHRHLDGSIRLETILDLAQQHHLSLPASDVETLRPYIQVTEPQPSVMSFIGKFQWMTYILLDYPACYRVAYENVEDALKEGLDYVELRFSPSFMAEAHKLDPFGVTEAVCAGVVDASRALVMPANVIGIISRTYGQEAGWNELQALLSQKERIVAIDLAGDEANYPATLFENHFKKARDAGWNVTVHAGEIAGAQSIWDAILKLGASRIGHAVAALSDRKLMAYMLDKRIAIECNLTSNVQTMTVKSYATHPVKQFLEYGLLATLNTDDPGISAINLAYEYEVAAPAAGLSSEQICQLQLNALEAAFLDTGQKQKLLQKKQNH